MLVLEIPSDTQQAYWNRLLDLTRTLKVVCVCHIGIHLKVILQGVLYYYFFFLNYFHP